MQEGDAAAYLESRRRWLLWVVRQQCHVPDGDAEDVVQIACLKIWRKWDTWEDRGRGRDPWAAQISYNAAMSWHRHRDATQRALNRLPPLPTTDVEALALLRSQIVFLWSQMTPRERRLCVAISCGYTQQERAVLCGMTPMAIKSKEFRMHHRLTALAAA